MHDHIGLLIALLHASTTPIALNYNRLSVTNLILWLCRYDNYRLLDYQILHVCMYVCMHDHIDLLIAFLHVDITPIALNGSQIVLLCN